MTPKEKIAARIRALLAKTVENGCTEDEAIAAAGLPVTAWRSILAWPATGRESC